MMFQRFLFLFITASLLAKAPPAAFSTCRFGATLALTSHSIHPKYAKALEFFSPRVAAHIKAGFFPKNELYFGAHVFGGWMQRVMDTRGWGARPRFDFGISAVLGTPVENVFLTSVEFGIKRTYYRIKSPDCELSKKESIMMGFIGFKTEGALTRNIASEVSYQYSLALMPTEQEAHFRYTKRASMHIFALGFVFKL